MDLPIRMRLVPMRSEIPAWVLWDRVATKDTLLGAHYRAAKRLLPIKLCSGHTTSRPHLQSIANHSLSGQLAYSAGHKIHFRHRLRRVPEALRAGHLMKQLLRKSTLRTAQYSDDQLFWSSMLRGRIVSVAKQVASTTMRHRQLAPTMPALASHRRLKDQLNGRAPAY